MKYILQFLSIALVIFSVNMGNAQCEPDFDFGEAEWGASPDPSVGDQFDTAYVDTPYADVFHVLVPTDASAIDPLFALPLDSVVLLTTVLTDTTSLEIVSLTDIGLDIVCNNLGSSPDPCTLISGAQYCASIEGTPTTAGVYQMTLQVEAFVTVFGVPVAQPYEFSGYILDVIGENTPDGISEVNITHWNVYPNPATDQFSITGLPSTGMLTITDLSGRIMSEYELSNMPANGVFDAYSWSNGMYVVHVLSNGKRSTKRLLIQH
ncbi:T9SS type A sorting domain-containing protein [Flavobacteriales bacterium]|nr:T9SS type A sorting domain-containing protein [Flavobacteriales bacterium]